MEENITVRIDGGIGRNIAATVMLRNLKKENPNSNINIVCSHPSIFKFNPNIKKAYPLNNAFLWDDVIKGTEYLTPEPYTNYNYYEKGEHISKVFCDEIKVGCDSKKPDLFFTEKEIQGANKFLMDQKKEVVLFQPFGQTNQTDEMYRDLTFEFAQKMVNALLKEGYAVIQISAEDQQPLKGATKLKVGLRPLMALISNCKAVIGVDSFLQHASNSFGKNTIVFWGGTDEGRVGYKEHTNIRAVKIKEHFPIRMEHNVPDGFHSNQGVNGKFDDEHINKVLKVIKDGR